MLGEPHSLPSGQLPVILGSGTAPSGSPIPHIGRVRPRSPPPPAGWPPAHRPGPAPRPAARPPRAGTGHGAGTPGRLPPKAGRARRHAPHRTPPRRTATRARPPARRKRHGARRPLPGCAPVLPHRTRTTAPDRPASPVQGPPRTAPRPAPQPRPRTSSTTLARDPPGRSPAPPAPPPRRHRRRSGPGPAWASPTPHTKPRTPRSCPAALPSPAQGLTLASTASDRYRLG